MAVLPPKINTYHCICSNLLFASTHTLKSLPRRSTSSSDLLNAAIILPIPIPPQPDTVLSSLPPTGYTMLLGLTADRKITIIRREDGFEKRILHRCTRCKLVVGYELESQKEAVDLDGSARKGKGKEEEYSGRTIYLLPAGIISTDVMMGQSGSSCKLTEDDVDLKPGALAAFE